jgi:hypothetical protein
LARRFTGKFQPIGQSKRIVALWTAQIVEAPQYAAMIDMIPSGITGRRKPRIETRSLSE